MPYPLSMGNEAVQDRPEGGGPVVIPVSSGIENISPVAEEDPDDRKAPERDREQSLDDSNPSEIDTGPKKPVDPKAGENE